MGEKFGTLELKEVVHFLPQTAARASVDAFEGDEGRSTVLGDNLRVIDAGIAFIATRAANSRNR